MMNDIILTNSEKIPIGRYWDCKEVNRVIPYLEQSVKKGRYGNVPLSQTVLLAHTTNYASAYSKITQKTPQSYTISEYSHFKVRQNQNVSANPPGLLVPYNI